MNIEIERKFWKNFIDELNEAYPNYLKNLLFRGGITDDEWLAWTSLDDEVRQDYFQERDIDLKHGEEKWVFIAWDSKVESVLKIPRNRYNSCADEAYLYECAKCDGYEDFFADCEYAFSINENGEKIDCFLMEKVDVDEERVNYEASEFWRTYNDMDDGEEKEKYYSENYWNEDDEEIVWNLFERYNGEGLRDELREWMRRHDINDLHQLNIGFTWSNVKFCDYSGYRVTRSYRRNWEV